MISSTYLLTVALQAAVLSVLSSAILWFVRQARYRAVIAICGLLAAGLLPWITALRPAPASAVVSQEITPASAPTALPVWTVVTLPAEIPSAAASVRQPATPISFVLPDPWQLALAFWATGSIGGFFLLGVAWLRQRNWRNSLVDIDDASWTRLRAIDSTLSDRKTFLLTSCTASPCVTGFRYPRVVLPRFLFTDESADSLGWAVRHELSHLRAGDSRWMIGLSLVRCLHWWNPFVHHLVSRWADARENLCDLAATEIPDSRNSYGCFLVTMAGRIQRRPPPLTVAMARRAPVRRLKSRIFSLLDAKPGAEKPVGSSFVSLSLLGFVVVGVLVSVLSIGAEEVAEVIAPAERTPALGKQAEPLAEAKPTANTEPAASPNPVAKAGKVGVIKIKTSTKFIAKSGESPLRDGMTFNDQKQREIMKQLAQAKGTYLMTAPSSVSLSGQKGAVEAIREVLGSPEQVSARTPGTPVPFVGTKLEFQIDLKDGLAELDSTVSFRFVPDIYQPFRDAGFGKPLPAGINPDDIRIFERKTSARLESGMTVVTDIGEIEPGLPLQMLVTVEAIDENGRRTVGFGDATVLQEKTNPDSQKSMATTAPSFYSRPEDSRPEGPLPTAEVAGKVRLSGEYVEFSLREGVRIPQEPMVQLVPSTSEISQSILSQSGTKVRKLKPVGIRLNEVATPWAEYPGLMLSAMSSSDFKRITVSSLPVGDGNNVEGLANMWRDLPNGSVMSFSLKSKDPKLERRLLIRVEAVK